MTTQGIRAVAIYVDDVTVQIANLTSFEFSKRPFDLGETSPTGGRLDQADSSVCRFSFIDSNGLVIQQLRAWTEARTRVSFVAAGVSTCVQWYERDTFTVNRRPATGKIEGRSDVYDFEIVRQGHGRHAIYQQTSLLAHLGWAQDGSTGIAKGYAQSGAGTLSWLNPNTQQIDHNAADAGIYADIIFPLQLSGFTFRLTSDIVNLHSEVGLAKLQIIGYDFAGTQILVDNLEFDSTGRKTVKFNSGAALHRIRVLPLLTPSGITVNDIVGVKEPALRIDAATDYVQN